MHTRPCQARDGGSSLEPAAPHRRYYEIAGVTVRVESDLPFATDTFDEKFESFRREAAGPDTVAIRHHFDLPDADLKAGGEEVYRKPPWAVYRTPDGWVYEGIAREAADPTLHRVAVFSDDHAHGELYNPHGAAEWWRAGGLHALSMFPSDQIWLGRLLPDRDACYLHSGGMIVDGRGLLFVGHSDAGKSTTLELVKSRLGERAEILCDDRNIVRRWHGDGARSAARPVRDGFWVHGTWSHGDVPEVSAAGAPLRAILFLEQSPANELVPIDDRKLVWQRLLATLIRPLVSGRWWERAMEVVEGVVADVPCYTMRFDRSGAVVPELEKLTR